MTFEVKPFDITDLVQRLRTEPGFSFARYGDGTFLSLWGEEGLDCDRAVINGDQAELLELTLRDKSITHGIGNLALTVGRAAEWLEYKGLDVEWYDCNVMHTASVHGNLNPFVKLLRKRRTMIIGPEHLWSFRAIPVRAFVTTHPTKAFYEVDSLEEKAKNLIPHRKIDTVCISAFTAAPVLVSRLHQHFPKLNILDVGSLWDVYAGKPSRKVFRDMSPSQIAKLKVKNFK